MTEPDVASSDAVHRRLIPSERDREGKRDREARERRERDTSLNRFMLFPSE